MLGAWVIYKTSRFAALLLTALRFYISLALRLKEI